MRKVLYLIITFCLAITLFGCTSKKTTYKFYNIIEKNNTAFSNTKKIADIKLKGVPKNPIEIGYFAYAGIYLEVNYIDGSKQKVDVNEGFFPVSDLNEFKTPGKKYFDLVYRGTHLALKFELVEASQPIKYLVNFHDRTGKVIYSTYCSYLEEVKCQNEKEIKNYVEGAHTYVFNGKWNYDITHIYSNLDVYPVYDKCFYANASDNYYANQDAYKIADIRNSGWDYNALLYVGRMKNVVLASLDKVEVTEQKNQTLTFDKKASYGSSDKLLNACLESIVNNVIKQYYIHDNWTPVWSDYFTFTNSNKLNFNTMVNSPIEIAVDDGSTSSVNMPNCITTSFNNYTGFSGFVREDGAKVSSKNVLDASTPEFFLTEYIGSGDTPSKAIFNITPDYKLGYYRADFVCDLDVFIDVSYTINPGYQYKREIVLNEVKIGFSYPSGEARFVLRYSADGAFDESGMPFTIQDKIVAYTLGSYTTE